MQGNQRQHEKQKKTFKKIDVRYIDDYVELNK